MQALKALVIVMGILIAIGVTVIGVTIYRRATDMVSDDKKAPVASATPPLAGAAPRLGTPAPGFGMRELDLAPGSTVVSVQPLDGRVLVHVRQPDGGTRILLFDPANGNLAGEWRAPGGTPP